MFGLKTDTSSEWAKLAEDNLKELLTDHAFAEQKAAGNAVSLIINYSEEDELVQIMGDIAIEEMEHFKMVHDILLKRGMSLGQDQRSDYAKYLHAYFSKTKDRTESLVIRLLIGALIEARSCERFKVLSENLNDPELAAFYNSLLKSEAGHHTLFLKLARKYQDRELVDAKWEGLLEHEGLYMAKKGNTPLVHG